MSRQVEALLGLRVVGALTVAIVLSTLILTAPASAASASRSDAPGVVFTITDESGVERVVTTQQLGRALETRKDLVFAGDRAGASTVSPLAKGRKEGKIFPTWNVYFNKSETNRIAAAGGAAVALGYVLSKIPSAPSAVVAAITQLGGSAIIAWAGIAVVADACVGLKTPLIGIRVPLPIYHRSGFCY